ncbi:hypothetical protein RUM44_010834 [Polyplax serrata]|uniref:Uncharacterized protein n=1 Tax=Polyplax serrata TaxID=468196 RepID=A0ABR1AND4_POLSC
MGQLALELLCYETSTVEKLNKEHKTDSGRFDGGFFSTSYTERVLMLSSFVWGLKIHDPIIEISPVPVASKQNFVSKCAHSMVTATLRRSAKKLHEKAVKDDTAD